MHRLCEIALTGLVAVQLHPLRSVVCCTALIVVLLPYLTGLALSQGLQAEAEASIQSGADLFVTGSRFGRPAAVPLEAVARIRRVEGVTAVVPRIVGEVVLGKERVPAVLVGLPPEHFPSWSAAMEGQLPRQDGRHELVIGTTLARRLELKIGSTLLPFYRNRRGERLSRVVGTFKPDAPLWQASLILTTFDSAATIFDQPGLATDLLVSCRPGYQDVISRTLERDLMFTTSSESGPVRLRVTAREDLQALLPRGLLHREGIFQLHFLLAIVVSILVLLVTSGLGLSERRREIGILKATGWQTDEILLRGLVESLALSLTGACVSLLLAWVWLRIFNAYGIAALFLAGADLAPDFTVPYRLTPVPVLLAFVLAFAVVFGGTLYSSWRAATTPPREAMR
jgi:ABC-type lipoprotein release transport system permease subunit